MVIIQGVGPCDLGSNPNTLTKNQALGRGYTHLIWDQDS